MLADNLITLECIGASLAKCVEEKHRTRIRTYAPCVIAAHADAYGVGTGLSGDPF